jgi:hypothetical protein
LIFITKASNNGRRKSKGGYHQQTLASRSEDANQKPNAHVADNTVDPQAIMSGDPSTAAGPADKTSEGPPPKTSSGKPTASQKFAKITITLIAKKTEPRAWEWHRTSC